MQSKTFRSLFLSLTLVTFLAACGGGGAGGGEPGPAGPAGPQGEQGPAGVATLDNTASGVSGAEKISVVSGTLVADAGVPADSVSGATVYAVGQQGTATTTDANGNFELTIDLGAASQISVVQKPLLQRFVSWLKGETRASTGFTQVGLVSQSATSLYGKKINLNLQENTQVNLPNITITKTGKISGNVKLQNGSDHTGIMVYVPGTSFLALSDAAGNFTISDVPEGTYNYLRAEKDGYKYSMLSSITVATNATTTVTSQMLLIDTGATGSILIGNGAAISTTKQVTANVAASDNAILMLYSESSIFLNASWEPLQSSFNYTFDTEGAKTIYIKFADANGLESPVYSDSITVNTNWTAPLTAPSTGARTNDTTPAFTWTADANASTYTLVISKNSDLSSPDLTKTGIADTTYTLAGGEALTASAGQLYYWSLAPVDATGVTGNYAAANSFTLDTGAPTVTSTTPADAAASVANTSAVTAVLSEAADSLSLDTSTFTLSAGGTPVTGTVSYDSATRTATFTPAANLAGTTSFTATLTTGVTDSAGNALAAAYPWSFTTAAGWVFPSGLTDHVSFGANNLGTSDAVSVAMNASGDIALAWVAYGETDAACGGLCYNIYAAHYKKSTRTWTLPSANTDHLNPLGRGCQNPQVGIDDSGNIIAVWAQYVYNAGTNSQYPQLYRARYTASSGTWATPANSAAFFNPGVVTSTNAYTPSLAIDPVTGRALVVWSQTDGNGSSVIRAFHSFYDPTNGWTDPADDTNAMLDTTTPLAVSKPKAAMAGGNLIIAWTVYDYQVTYKTSIYAITGTYSAAGTVLGAPATVHLNAQNNVSDIDLAIAQDGSQGMVVYVANDAAPKSQIYVATWDGAAWTKPTAAADHISYASTDAYLPQVAYDSTGKAVAVWKQYDGTFSCSYNPCTQIFKATWSGSAWTKPIDLTDNITPDAQHAAGAGIAFDTAGNGIITWVQNNGSDVLKLYRSEYRSGAWSSPVLADGYSVADGDMYYPMMFMAGMSDGFPISAMGGGDAILTWMQKDGTTDCSSAACTQLFKAEYR